MTSPAFEPLLNKISPHFIALKVKGIFHEIIRIHIQNEDGERKISLWQELNSGINNIAIDISSLTKGNYLIQILDKHENLKVEELFTL